MTNSYYTSPSDLAAQTKARSIDINNLDATIDAAFDKLPTELALKTGSANYGVDTGVVANSYVITLASAITSYTDGMEVKMRPTRTNTGACTLNVNGIGIVAIKRNEGTDPRASDIVANGPVTFRFNSLDNSFYLPPLVNSDIASQVGPVTSVNGLTGNVLVDPAPFSSNEALEQAHAIALSF